MERLTSWRNDLGRYVVKLAENRTLYVKNETRLPLLGEIIQQPGPVVAYGDIVDKLADYEEREQSGELQMVPCKIGDTVWAIRRYRDGARVAQRGIVSAMCYLDDMSLAITVKGVCRGEWGKRVFPTRIDAELAMRKERGG